VTRGNYILFRRRHQRAVAFDIAVRPPDGVDTDAPRRRLIAVKHHPAAPVVSAGRQRSPWRRDYRSLACRRSGGTLGMIPVWSNCARVSLNSVSYFAGSVMKSGSVPRQAKKQFSQC
jgi:hypothetical protein